MTPAKPGSHTSRASTAADRFGVWRLIPGTAASAGITRRHMKLKNPGKSRARPVPGIWPGSTALNVAASGGIRRANS
ncbi:hypothetical protein [Glycomyces tenuis]|uniref:hypothetical protein n=1 Tax=Glycomyces tenuis TaxID=58116 RepID=UPI00047CD3C0|nr:hypothetical protein [Glycomyces tenuis]